MRFSYSAWFVAVLALLVPRGTLAAEQGGDPAREVESAIRHAETYYALGMVEQDNPLAYQAGLRHVDLARQLLEDLPATAAKRKLDDDIKRLKDNLEGQAEAASDTLGGAFPLLRFLTSSLSDDSQAVATYQLIGDPATRAGTNAVAPWAVLAAGLDKTGRQTPLPVIFTIDPWNQAIENASLRMFRASPRLRVYTHADVAAALTREELAKLQTDPIAVKDALLKKLGPTALAKVLVVKIQQSDIADDVYCYTAEAVVLGDEGGGSPREALVTTGFSRDRRDQLVWIVLANAALLAVAYAACAVTMYSRRARDGWRRALVVVPLVGFAVGRVLSWAVALLLGSIRLSPEAPALASWWLPSLAGLALLAIPMAAYWLASPWFVRLWPVLGSGNRGGAMFLAIGAGIASCFVRPLLLYVEDYPAIDLALATTIVMALAYLAGRALDYADRLPVSFALVPLVLTMPAGVAMLHATTGCLAIAAVSIVAAGTAVVAWNSMVRRGRRPTGKPPDPVPTGQTDIHGGIPADVQELIQRAENPDYQWGALADQVRDRVSDVLESRTSHLGLFGVSGTGKTATAEAIASHLMRELAAKGQRPALLRGACPQPTGKPIAYAPFRQALAEHFEVGLLAAPGPKIQQISQALGGLFGSVIPFARILFPHAEDYGDLVARPEEIRASIAWMLRRLSKTRPVLLFLDDVQWLDEASAALLKYLLKEFPAGGDTAVAIVLAANDKACLEDLGLDMDRRGVELRCPSAAEQVQVLVGGVGLQRAVAQEVLARIGPAGEAGGGLLWPLQVVAKLARSGAFVRTAEGFGWANAAWPADFTIPVHMQAAVCEQWQNAADYRTILECAACGCEGREFHASVLADALGKPRLEMLVLLDEIERRTGLIHEIRDRDDVYAFHSSFLLEVIRREMGISGDALQRADVPHRVREYHARLAAALEDILKVSSGKLYDVANLFFAAGPRHAAKGVEYCLRAAAISAASYDFRRAKDYLDMAGQCAESSGLGSSVETERQILACQEAQVTGHGEVRTQAAESALKYLSEHADAPARLILAVAELCYEEGHRSRKQKWHEEAARLCRQVVLGGASDEGRAAGGDDLIPHPSSLVPHPSPLLEARALHIMAISQPRERREERIAGLRKAYRLLENSKPEDREASQWFASIMNSLAKDLRKGNAPERAEAKVLFQSRLRMEKERNLGDLQGVATALGGLGRLEWFGTPRDLPGAEQHFRKSLEMAEAIGDAVAQVKMLSFLGGCVLERGDVKQATALYERSWQRKGDTEDRCFAGIGLLRCCQLTGETPVLPTGRTNALERFEAVAKELLELVRTDREKVPDDCKNPLREVLRACPAESRSDTVRSLLDLL